MAVLVRAPPFAAGFLLSLAIDPSRFPGLVTEFPRNNCGRVDRPRANVNRKLPVFRGFFARRAENARFSRPAPPLLPSPPSTGARGGMPEPLPPVRPLCHNRGVPPTTADYPHTR